MVGFFIKQAAKQVKQSFADRVILKIFIASLLYQQCLAEQIYQTTPTNIIAASNAQGPVVENHSGQTRVQPAIGVVGNNGHVFVRG